MASNGMAPPKSGSDEPHRLQCLEVWGGSDRAEHKASVPGLDISVYSDPIGGETGGDLYLISSCSSGLIARMLIADVSGHGSGVSEFAAQLRSAMHKSINTVDQSKIAEALNNAFEDIGGGSRFATALLVTHYAPTGHLIFVNAGHPPPLIRRDGSDSWERVHGEHDDAIRRPTRALRIGLKNLPLGVIGDTAYEQFAIKVHPGDELVCYTDAFTEAKDAEGRMAGVEGLAGLLNEGAVEGSMDHASGLLAEMRRRGYETSDDDHTLMTLRLNGEGPPRIGMGALGRALVHNFGIGHTDTRPGG